MDEDVERTRQELYDAGISACRGKGSAADAHR